MEKQNFNKMMNQNTFAKSKSVICPQCKKESKIEKKSNNIIIKCENGHETGPFKSFEHFQESQKIDLSQIKCGCNNCNNNRSICKNFFKCNICKINLCESCKIKHANVFINHYIINYDDINYICCCDKEGHRDEKFISYCNRCHANLCWVCEGEHEIHGYTELRSLLPKKDDYINNMKKVNDLLIIFRNIINTIILILISIFKSYELNNKIINDVKSGFNIQSRNYITMSNNKEVNEIQENMYNFLNEITQEKTIIGFFNKIINLSNRNFNINEINNKYSLNNINNKDIKYFIGEISMNRMNKNIQQNRFFIVRNTTIQFNSSFKNNNEENINIEANNNKNEITK